MKYLSMPSELNMFLAHISITYDSDVDFIKIEHVAHSRQGFALGAVIAAEWILGKQGVFSMKDVLNLG